MAVEKTPAIKPAKSTRKPVAKAPKKATLDDVWAAMRELQEMNKDVRLAHEETEKSLNKFIEENREAIAEINKKLNKVIDEPEPTFYKTFGGVGDSSGSLIEQIMTTDLTRKFKKFGFVFNWIKSVKYAEGVYAEINGLLENSTQVMVIVIEITLRQTDIDEHLKRMEKVRIHADQNDDKREFLGAIAATVVDESTKKYALSKGLFIIEPSGENVKITKPVSEPQVW